METQDQKLWECLQKWQDIEPSPTYQSAFWTRLTSGKPWYQRSLENISKVLLKPAPAFAALALIFIFGFFMTKGLDPSAKIARLSQEEIQMIENLELAENYVIIKDIEFWENLEVIEKLDLPHSRLTRNDRRMS